MSIPNGATIDSSRLFAALHRFAVSTDNPAGITDDAAKVITQGAREPRLTGQLAESKTITAGPGGSTITWSAPYAAAVHAGSRGVSGNPFATEAVTRLTDQTVEVMRAGVSKLLQAHGLY